MRQQDFKRHLARFQKCLTSSVRNPGTEQEERYYHFTTEAMQKENKLNPYYELLSSALYEMDMDNNSRYKYTYYAIQTIMDSAQNTIEELEDTDYIYDAAANDTDDYTYDLTKWLNASVNNVYYLTEAIEQRDAIDGFMALKEAQRICIEEIYIKIQEIIVEFLKSKEE